MDGPILKKHRFEEAQDLLNKWAYFTLNLEEQYYIQNNEISNRDYNFLKIIGQGVYSLNSFNSLLISSIEKFNNDTPKQNESYHSFLKNLSEYIRFFNNLIASKIKFFFFREMPILNTNNPFVQLDFKILNAANDLLLELSREKIIIDNVKEVTARYFFYQTLLYAFVYSHKKEKGFFLKFEYNYIYFNQLRKILLKNYKKDDSESSLRWWGSSLLGLLSIYYSRLETKSTEKNKSLSNIALENVKKPDCYNALFDKLQTTQELLIEPFTYHFCDIIWKVDGMLHDEDEILLRSDKAKHDHIINHIIGDFIKKYFNITNAMIDSKSYNFKELFEVESEFFSKIYPVIFHQEDIKIIRKKLGTLRQCIKNDKIRIYKLETNNNLNIISILQKIRSAGETGFKMKSLVELLTPNELIFFLASYSEIIPDDIVNERGTEFVGFYKSGIFLAHIVNLFKKLKNYNYQYKDIWLFKTKPYVATHPIHIDQPKIDFKNIIVFDECFKTGFTYSLYESYLVRNLYYSNVSIYGYSLFDFTYYKRIEFRKHPSLHSLVQLNNNYLPLNFDELNLIERFVLNNLESSLQFMQLSNMNELISKLQYTRKINQSAGIESYDIKSVDLTFLLTNTHLVFSICFKFASYINERIKNKGEKLTINLFTPSDDGQLLAIITALLLKLLYKFDVKFNELENFGSYFNVAIDLSFVTGFSLAYSYSIKKYGSYNPSNFNQLLKDFDAICTILNLNSDFDRIFTLYHYV